MLTQTGFAEATFHGWTGYVTSSCTQGGLITARKPDSASTSRDSRPQASLMARAASLIYGAVCYLIFLGSVLYAIAFVGNVIVSKTVDAGPQVPLSEALVVNLLLLGLFAVQHSVMARPAFKRWWTKLVPAHVERSTYVLVSSLLLLLLFWQWRPMPEVVWQAHSSLVTAACWILFAAGWLVVLISTFLIDHFDLFGLRQVYLYARGRPYLPPPFRAPALYRLVRHPIMLGFLIAFWASPTMTWGHLLFAGMTTAYIVVGIWFEERDLRHTFGPAYAEYQQQVGMLMPWIGRSSRGV
jgi:protein-S-isoprenylcysteine O-methyltransferase Ste14